MPELLTRDQIEPRLRATRSVAVLGAHVEAHRPARYVPDFLAARGLRVIPVNPAFVGHQAWGEPFRASLAELTEPIDLVDVFRAPYALPGHLDDLFAMRPLPGLVWLQQGIRHDGVTRALVDAGIDVVQDRCTLADWQRWGLP